MQILEKIWIPLISACSGALLGVFATTTGYLNKDKELNISMLQIALGILREDPEKSQITAVRSWAIDVINYASPVEISAKARTELLSKKLSTDIWFDMGGYSGGSYHGGYSDGSYVGGYVEPKGKPRPKPDATQNKGSEAQ
jgi:hypothetical protein